MRRWNLAEFSVLEVNTILFLTVMAFLAILLGLVLWLYYDITGGWLHAKIFFVGLLIAYQLQTTRYILQIKQAKILKTSLFFRVFNEAGLLLVVPILILVVLKPF